ncbi:MAG: D-alanine--D-alanine ligase family protein [Caldilineaceae bacterium]
MGNERPLRIGVIFGGRSSEHEVSLASARNVMDALTTAGYAVVPIGITPQGHWLTSSDPMKLLVEPTSEAQNHGVNGSTLSSHHGNGHNDSWALLPQSKNGTPLPTIDVLWPVLHGPYGEDGTIQGMLEMANLPYVGCGVLASAVCMDKALAKVVFAACGLPQTPWFVVMRNHWKQSPEMALDEIEQNLGDYPFFVKPANLGSSVGISKARNRSELAKALTLAARFDRKLLVEKAVPNARELEISVLGNDDPIASVPGEIKPGNEFYDYAAKYLDDNSDLIIPANLSAELIERMQLMAIQAFKAADASGLARVDFLMDGVSERIFLNEVNTMPGFTRISMYPKLFEASGVSYPELADKLIKLALDRYADRQMNETSRTIN